MEVPLGENTRRDVVFFIKLEDFMELPLKLASAADHFILTRIAQSGALDDHTTSQSIRKTAM